MEMLGWGLWLCVHVVILGVAGRMPCAAGFPATLQPPTANKASSC